MPRHFKGYPTWPALAITCHQQIRPVLLEGATAMDQIFAVRDDRGRKG